MKITQTFHEFVRLHAFFEIAGHAKYPANIVKPYLDIRECAARFQEHLGKTLADLHEVNSVQTDNPHSLNVLVSLASDIICPMIDFQITRAMSADTNPTMGEAKEVVANVMTLTWLEAPNEPLFDGKIALELHEALSEFIDGLHTAKAADHPGALWSPLWRIFKAMGLTIEDVGCNIIFDYATVKAKQDLMPEDLAGFQASVDKACAIPRPLLYSPSILMGTYMQAIKRMYFETVPELVSPGTKEQVITQDDIADSAELDALMKQ